MFCLEGGGGKWEQIDSNGDAVGRTFFLRGIDSPLARGRVNVAESHFPGFARDACLPRLMCCLFITPISLSAEFSSFTFVCVCYRRFFSFFFKPAPPPPCFFPRSPSLSLARSLSRQTSLPSSFHVFYGRRNEFFDTHSLMFWRRFGFSSDAVCCLHNWY